MVILHTTVNATITGCMLLPMLIMDEKKKKNEGCCHFQMIFSATIALRSAEEWKNYLSVIVTLVITSTITIL
jgi:hypothetical protein